MPRVGQAGAQTMEARGLMSTGRNLSARLPTLAGMKPNRIAVYLTALSGLAAAVAVPVANLDTSSTVGVLGGLVAILGVAVKWLDGWQKYEEQRAVYPGLEDRT